MKYLFLILLIFYSLEAQEEFDYRFLISPTASENLCTIGGAQYFCTTDLTSAIRNAQLYLEMDYDNVLVEIEGGSTVIYYAYENYSRIYVPSGKRLVLRGNSFSDKPTLIPWGSFSIEGEGFFEISALRINNTSSTQQRVIGLSAGDIWIHNCELTGNYKGFELRQSGNHNSIKIEHSVLDLCEIFMYNTQATVCPILYVQNNTFDRYPQETGQEYFLKYFMDGYPTGQADIRVVNNIFDVRLEGGSAMLIDLSTGDCDYASKAINIDNNIFASSLGVYAISLFANQPVMCFGGNAELLGSVFYPMKNNVVVKTCDLALEDNYIPKEHSIVLDQAGLSYFSDNLHDLYGALPGDMVRNDIGAAERRDAPFQTVPQLSLFRTYLDPPGTQYDIHYLSAGQTSISVIVKHESSYPSLTLPCASKLYYTISSPSDDHGAPSLESSSTEIGDNITINIPQNESQAIVRYFGLDNYGRREIIDDNGDDYHTVIFSNVTPTITINSPVNFDRWIRLQSYQIAWSSTGLISRVAIDLLNSEGEWVSIGTDIENNGLFVWQIPFEVPLGDAIIRIKDVDSPTEAFSGAVTISDPDLAFLSPYNQQYEIDILPSKYYGHIQSMYEMIKTSVTYMNDRYYIRDYKYTFFTTDVTDPLTAQGSPPSFMTLSQYNFMNFTVPMEFAPETPLSYSFYLNIKETANPANAAQSGLVVVQVKGHRLLQPLASSDIFTEFITPSNGTRSVFIPYNDENPNFPNTIYPYSWTLVSSTFPTGAGITLDQSGKLSWNEDYYTFDPYSVTIRVSDGVDASQLTYVFRILPEKLHPIIEVGDCNCGVSNNSSETCELTVREDELAGAPIETDGIIYMAAPSEEVSPAGLDNYVRVEPGTDGKISLSINEALVSITGAENSPAVSFDVSGNRIIRLYFYATSKNERYEERNRHKLVLRFKKDLADCLDCN
ncbi:MAG: hypothetical protein A2487_14670 [Candidatus Raymondbacteria bacterium RifOxyC12_full_50_8]|uniref:Uncharacterized protein n=1 Tax=Candidatus Raymondbacteria bacterium RIFOXYD12_FULL_49_13 TaxID=1817890 RepID=A0A1F7FLC7_UNCRA|nr:MAG: hypothetical protein A2487_14670 [Candidatus Raymondbacteria bacterium RifOxyC12_full_50_8]OGK07438.1 MAG: hypothetical protein A2519_11105 [Candidatus Raymondbacteria bacterium RIFOXYD12_FULL_49_13]